MKKILHSNNNIYKYSSLFIISQIEKSVCIQIDVRGSDKENFMVSWVQIYGEINSNGNICA